MIVRQLSLDDRGRVLDLFQDNEKLFKQTTSPAYHEGVRRRIMDFLENKTHRAVVIGAIDEDRLTGLLCAFPWVGLPYYTLGYLKTQNPEGNVKKYIRTFDLIVTHTVQLMESDGRFDFYYLNFLRNYHLNALSEHKKLNDIPRYFSYLQERYHLSVQGVVMPGQKSQFKIFNDMLGGETFSIPLWIRMGSLKEEFRNQYFARAIRNSIC